VTSPLYPTPGRATTQAYPTHRRSFIVLRGAADSYRSTNLPVIAFYALGGPLSSRGFSTA
jgi:hypothetical protein